MQPENKELLIHSESLHFPPFIQMTAVNRFEPSNDSNKHQRHANQYRALGEAAHMRKGGV